jgi:hypothetical protein
MIQKKKPEKPSELPQREIKPEVEAPVDPKNPFIGEDDPDVIPFEDPFEPPPYEIPPPGEGPL